MTMTTRSAPPKLPSAAFRALIEIAQHRMLDTTQVARLCFPANNPSWTRQILSALRKAGYVTSVERRLTAPELGSSRRINLPSVWHATDKGVTAARGMPGQRGNYFHRMSEDNAMTNTQSHTLHVNEVGVLVTEGLRDHCPVEWTHEVRHTLKRPPRPTVYLHADATISIDTTRITDHQTPASFILELDRDNSPLFGLTKRPGLADKIGLYAAYSRATDNAGRPAWAEHYRLDPSQPSNGFPAIWTVIDAATPAESEQRRDQLLTALKDTARFPLLPSMWLMVSTLDDLRNLGALGPHAHNLDGQVTNVLGQPVT